MKRPTELRNNSADALAGAIGAKAKQRDDTSDSAKAEEPTQAGSLSVIQVPPGPGIVDTPAARAEVAAAVEIASDDDREWFARHPQRTLRLRPSVPGEWAMAQPDQPFTLVRQVFPGGRVRSPVDVHLAPEFFAEGPSGEELLAALVEWSFSKDAIDDACDTLRDAREKHVSTLRKAIRVVYSDPTGRPV